jgi:hypothetical protein
VRRTNGDSWYTLPLRIKPERGQVDEDGSKDRAVEESDHVFDEEISGFKFPKQTHDLGPEPAMIGRAAVLAVETHGLAREARAEDIDERETLPAAVG